MSLLDRVRNRLNRWEVQWLARRPIDCRPRRPLVSFSFDDFPRSAWQVAGPILAEHHMQATYYVALGLAGQSNSGGELFTLDDLQAVADAGHELGCHTFGHDDSRAESTAAYEAALEQNRQRLSELLPDRTWQTFAYPYGRATAGAKRLVERRFRCARGIWPGINHGRADANYLHANAIYSCLNPVAHCQQLIRENIARRGWLIFYSHDVRERPSNFGCTPDDFAAVVRAAAAADCDVVTVAEAIAQIADGM